MPDPKFGLDIDIWSNSIKTYYKDLDRDAEKPSVISFFCSAWLHPLDISARCTRNFDMINFQLTHSCGTFVYSGTILTFLKTCCFNIFSKEHLFKFKILKVISSALTQKIFMFICLHEAPQN